MRQIFFFSIYRLRHRKTITQSVQLLSRVWLFATPGTAACQASLSITNSWSLLKLIIKSVIPSNHLILCRPRLPLPSTFPNIRIFSSESVLHIKVAKVLKLQLQHQLFQWIFRTDLRWTGWISLRYKGLSRVFSNTTVQKHHSSVLSFLYGLTLTSIHDYWKNHSFE